MFDPFPITIHRIPVRLTASEARHGPLTTVVYPVKDLIASDEPGEMAECLLNILLSAVEPASWERQSRSP